MPIPSHFFADLVREACRAGGTGALALDGALPGNRRFADVVPVGAVFGYAIAGIARPEQWETGTARIDSAGHLERISVAASSNAGARVDFTPLLKSVALTVGAGWYAAVSQPLALTDVAGLNDALAGKQALGNYATAGHGHVLADMAGLQAALDSKQMAGSYAPASHSHVIGDVTGLQTALDGKQAAGSYAAAGHGHVIANITGLQAALDAKQPLAAPLLSATGVEDGDQLAVSRGGVGYAVPGSALVRVNASGRVGIGTASPGFTLDVAGTGIRNVSATTAAFYLRTTSNGNRDGELSLDSGGNLIFRNTTAGSLFFDSFNGIIYFRNLGAGATQLATISTGGIAPGSDNNRSLGTAALRFSTVFAASGVIATSDRAMKKHIGKLPDGWLDAWGDVRWQRYRFRKGMRWHAGLIAQDVCDAFAVRGQDAGAMGLLCRDTVDGGTRWGLRYDECFALEAAWQRRELARLAARVAALEADA